MLSIRRLAFDTDYNDVNEMREQERTEMFIPLSVWDAVGQNDSIRAPPSRLSLVTSARRQPR